MPAAQWGVCVCVVLWICGTWTSMFKQDVLPKLTNSKKCRILRYAKNLLGGFKYFSFSPLLGIYLGMIFNLTNIFQLGWFNHQLAYRCESLENFETSFGDSASCGAPEDSFSFDYVSCKRPKDTDPTLASWLEFGYVLTFYEILVV